jgi:hypothetical protein
MIAVPSETSVPSDVPAELIKERESTFRASKVPDDVPPAKRQRRRLILYVVAAVVPLAAFIALYVSPLKTATAESSSRRLSEAFSSQSLRHQQIGIADDFYSTVHCVGENFGHDAWKYKSCQFRNLCFDTESKEYVLFPSKEEMDLQDLLDGRSDGFATVSSTMKNAFVSLGALSPRWRMQQSALQWFPKMETDRTKLDSRGAYFVPADVVMLPFHSFQASHSGHLLWDDWFPIYLLLSMFGMEHQQQLLLVRHVLDRPLEGACDASADNQRQCQINFQKYLPLLGINPTSHMFATSNDFPFGGPLSPYVCAKYGAAGLGMLANHELKQSGWNADDYKMTHTVGYADIFWQFRMFLAKKLLTDIPSDVPSTFKVTFAWTAPSPAHVRMIDQLQQELASSSVEISSLAMDTKDLKEQASVVSQSYMLVTDCSGEGIAAAVFLPRHSSLVNCCDKSSSSELPPSLAWDILNHTGYIRVHWVSPEDMTSQLVSLIRSEVELSQSSYG